MYVCERDSACVCVCDMNPRVLMSREGDAQRDALESRVCIRTQRRASTGGRVIYMYIYIYTYIYIYIYTYVYLYNTEHCRAKSAQIRKPGPDIDLGVECRAKGVGDRGHDLGWRDSIAVLEEGQVGGFRYLVDVRPDVRLRVEC